MYICQWPLFFPYSSGNETMVTQCRYGANAFLYVHFRCFSETNLAPLKFRRQRLSLTPMHHPPPIGWNVHAAWYKMMNHSSWCWVGTFLEKLSTGIVAIKIESILPNVKQKTRCKCVESLLVEWINANEWRSEKISSAPHLFLSTTIY